MKRTLSLLILAFTSFGLVAQINSGNASSRISQTSAAAPASDNRYETIEIPVVVHVVYNSAAQNISDAQILSQLEVLNKDFNGANEDISKVPSYFAAFTGKAGFSFKLAKVNPQGLATSGIIRKQTPIQLFTTDDRVKDSNKGGDDAWDRNRYMNIWICNLAGGIAGYTSPMSGAAEKDGVVIRSTAFGTTGNVVAPFNLGRTATHEVAHWLNLRHIWGDDYCGDDGVDDTPQQRSSNKGCPEGKKFSCGTTANGDMYMNFMDLTNDACMFMFTKGQVTRMRAQFENGGLRYPLLASNALSGSLLQLPAAIPVEPVEKVVSALYPNPAGATITLETSGIHIETINSTLVIYNNIGQPVMTETVKSARTTLNISHLKPGVYLVKWANGASRFGKK